MGRSLAMASAPGSKRNFSKNSTSTRLFVYPTVSSRLTHQFPPISFSSTAQDQQERSGIMNCHCLRDANSTQRPCHYNMKNLRTVWHGGKDGKKTDMPGELMPSKY